MKFNRGREDFFRFAFGFVAMLSLGFATLVAIGVYQVEIVGSKNISATDLIAPLVEN